MCNGNTCGDHSAPLQIVDIGNGCEAYSTSIYIPAKSELTATMQSLIRLQFFLDYNFQYANVSNFVVWYKTDFANLTKEEIESLKAKIMKLPTMPMDIFDKTLETIDENYAFSLSPKLILALLILTGVCFVIFGILFIWYKRKTTLTTSTTGHLYKLIPSLKEKKPSLNSLLPILSEFVHPTNAKTTNLETTNAVPRKSSPTQDEQSLPVMIPHLHHIKSNKLKMALPSTKMQNKMEPISLELFNCDATDLNEKGEIELEKYKNIYSTVIKTMDAAFEFAVNGPNMEFVLDLMRDGHSIPASLFIDIMTEKCQLINKHIRDSKDCLVMMASITNTMASIKFYDKDFENYQLLHITLSNLPDLEDQLCHLWTEVLSLLWDYHIDDHAAELASIDTFYSNLEYEELVKVNFML